jgi:hypothetical protein
VLEELLSNFTSKVFFVIALPRVLSITLAIDKTSAHNALEVSIPMPPMPISPVAISSYIQKH